MKKIELSKRYFAAVRIWMVLGLSVSLFLLVVFTVSSTAQVKPVYDRGISGLGQTLKRLNTSSSVLMIGAHPDDEDTALLSYLARGESARTAYLSLTRGDGGQNILGTELGEALGLIRTEELIQARRLDGAEQYFARAYDYGFSKTLAEAKQKWDEKIVLCDVVRVIRQFRPMVVISQFSGTPADGHGQHQYSGYISPLAVTAANDAGRCKSAGPAWQVRKFYVRHRGAGEPKLRINTGKYDFTLGRSYFEIAMEARSQHKSQEQGVLELKGDQSSSLNLAASEARESGIFDGLDTSISGASAYYDVSDETVKRSLKELAEKAEKALREFEVRKPDNILSPLTDGYRAAVKAGNSESAAGAKAFFERKEREFAEAVKLAAGIQIDALSDRETAAPNEFFAAAVKAFIGQTGAAKVISAKIIAPTGWQVKKAEAPPETNQGFFRRETGDFAAYFTIGVAADAVPTQPYWLAKPRDGDLFRWSADDDQRTLPFHQPLPFAEVVLDILGTEVVLRQPVEYRYADDTRGEIRRLVNVVPRVSVEIDQPLLIVPFSKNEQKRKLVMTVTNRSNNPVTGGAGLIAPTGSEWPVTASERKFDLKKTGERATLIFEITIPAGEKGNFEITAQAVIDGETASSTMQAVAYEHIQTHRIYRPALVDVKIFDLKAAPVGIGYVPGSGDRVPEAIRQMGLSVELLDANQLASGDLSAFDVIVVGIRASEVRPDFAANNKRLLEFAKNGGTLIVQYQRPVYTQQALTPYPARVGPRVADENAPVRILEPGHPVFNFPNKITEADFLNWVQERNLYNFAAVDEKYLGLLESHDAGEPENKGGLVIADVGKGKFIYCSYSFFRQLPAGVSGAYRLFANLLSLPKYEEGRSRTHPANLFTKTQTRSRR